ncbi:MAG: cyclase family protein [Bilophila wadsworthia]
MMWFGMTDHTGTHIDAPLHFVPGGSPSMKQISALYSMPGVFPTSPPYPASTRSMRARERELKQYGSIPRNAFIDPYGHGLVFQYAGIFQFPFITLPLRNASSGSVRWLWASTAPPWTTAGERAPHPPRLPVP